MPRKMKNKAVVPAEEPPTKRTKLFDEDAVSDDEAVNLTVNEEFAKRFEHNKKREEKQRRNSHLSVFTRCPSANVTQSRKSTRTKTLKKTHLPMRMKTMPPNWLLPTWTTRSLPPSMLSRRRTRAFTIPMSLSTLHSMLSNKTMPLPRRRSPCTWPTTIVKIF